MSRSGMLVALLASAAAGAGTMWWLAGRHTHTVSAAPEPATRQVLYWYDPMVPTQRFDQPGKSPFMDMPLVPKYAGEVPAAPEAMDGRETHDHSSQERQP